MSYFQILYQKIVHKLDISTATMMSISTLFRIILKTGFCLLLFATTNQGFARTEKTSIEQTGLTSKDATQLMYEMMAVHPAYKTVTSELVQRVLYSFCIELDPLKIYFLESELNDFLHPSPEMVQSVLYDIQEGQFTHFKTLFASMPEKVANMRVLESEIRQLIEKADTTTNETLHELPKYEFWPKDRQEQLSYIKNIYITQDNAISKLANIEQKERACKTLAKLKSQYEHKMTPDATSSLFERGVMTLYVKAFAQSLDSQTMFFSPSEAKQFLFLLQQRLSGIGVILRDDYDGLTVTKILENSPAEYSHEIFVDDKIIAIDQQPIIGLDLEEAVNMIRGKAGTKVRLTILRKAENGVETTTKDIYLIREEIATEEKRYSSSIKSCSDNDGVMGYIHLTSFYQDEKISSYDDILQELIQLQNKSCIRGVILDLRNNPGGLLTQAVAVSGLFMDKGVVVSIKDDQHTIYHMRNVDSKKIWDGPLVILVNRASASAAEIVAQTLQDWGRGIVVGDDRTFGKGSYQTLTFNIDKNAQLNPKGEYKITRGRYYTVSGKSPQLVGVIPDIVVPGPYQFSELGECFLRYPLPEDTISSSFDDTFDDLPFYQKIFAQCLYKYGKQERLFCFTQFLPTLVALSQKRQINNTPYQQFLHEYEEVVSKKLKQKYIQSAAKKALKKNLLNTGIHEDHALLSGSDQVIQKKLIQEKVIQKKLQTPAQTEKKEDTIPSLCDEEEMIPDFQLEEAWNILQDLIHLHSKKNILIQ